MHSNFLFKVQSPALNANSPSQQWHVPAQGGTIGRSPECTWVLNDPNRIVSRQHARVDVEGDRCHWTDLGTNTTHVNGKPMLQGQRVPLNAGDVLKIGDNLIVLEVAGSDWSGLDSFLPSLTKADDPLASLMPAAAPQLNIDDLLAELNLPAQADAVDDFSHERVLAQRMYVGFQQGRAEMPELPPAVVYDPAELLRVKKLLKVSVQGCMQLLAARRIFQQEMGGTLTTISSKANNPLKFFSSAEEAMQRLLGEPAQGYLAADEALVQAYQDLQKHMEMSVARIQKLIDQVNAELDPEKIMEDASRTGSFTLGLSAARKARLWDLYCERYKKLGDTWS